MFPKRKILLSALLIVCIWGSGYTQITLPPFWNDVQAFKKADSIHPPAKHPILLIGSSSFTKWKDVQEYFPQSTFLNRAFGGSTLLDLIRYHEDIVDPYYPAQILIYCGENDFASNDSVSVEMVVERFIRLFKLIRKKYHRVPVVYVSMKPSPSREKLLPKYEMANERIAAFLQSKKHATFVDVYSKMFSTDHKILEDIYLADRLHMNAKGYAIWQKILEPVIIKN